jgi:adenylate cyclase class 2
MAFEIELKAHITDCESIKRQLEEKAEYSNSFEKEDVYWLSDEAAPRTAPFSIFKIRVRKEKRRFSDGTGESLCFLIYKKKEVRDDIEINDEKEFEIRASSGRKVEEIGDLLEGMGLNRGAFKKKRGWAFIGRENPGPGRICAELVEVEGLGWFVELEILADNNRDETVAEGKKRLLDFLDKLGIGRQAIEGRYYTEMLENPDSAPTPGQSCI